MPQLPANPRRRQVYLRWVSGARGTVGPPAGLERCFHARQIIDITRWYADVREWPALLRQDRRQAVTFDSLSGAGEDLFCLILHSILHERTPEGAHRVDPRAVDVHEITLRRVLRVSKQQGDDEQPAGVPGREHVA